MGRFEEIAKKVPVVSSVYRMLRKETAYCQLEAGSAEQVFTDIYRNNTWGGRASRSGAGSDVHQTRNIIKELPTIFNEFKIKTMLDLPCGDFYWMKYVDLLGIDYIGADIVDELITKNTKKYTGKHIRFQRLNLIEDNLPKVDLVFCRDCLVHFSFDDIIRALSNICCSHSGLILTTTFAERKENDDIATGEWRVLNLEAAPFMLPRPLKIIYEGCTEGGGAYADKALGLWRLADIQESLARHSPCPISPEHSR